MTRYFSVILLCAFFGWGSKFQIIQSTSQEWFGGLQESGYGTDYKLNIKVKAGSDQLQITDLWVGDNHLTIKTKGFEKGSQVLLSTGITFKPDPSGQIKPLAADGVKKPYDFKGEGLLGYTFKGRKAYVEIDEFKKLEKIIYP